MGTPSHTKKSKSWQNCINYAFIFNFQLDFYSFTYLDSNYNYGYLKNIYKSIKGLPTHLDLIGIYNIILKR